MTGVVAETEMIADLRERLKDELARVIGPSPRVALIDFPNDRNSGDSAIWRGERRVLAELGAVVAYTRDMAGYDADRLRERIGADGVILITGGGNFGDYWPRHQALRESVLRDFPAHRVVQLPQSIAIRDRDNVARIRQAMAWHERFTVMVRDAPSLELAADLALDARMTPDAAFGLGAIERPVPVRKPLLVLARDDHERKFDLSAFEGPDVVVSDWRLSTSQLARRTALRVAPSAARHWRAQPRLDRWTARLREGSLEAMSRLQLESALRQLAGFSVVVTDRLHAHVLCCLLGIPHVVLDNDYGKIRAVHEAWTANSATTWLAGSVEEARSLAAVLLD